MDGVTNWGHYMFPRYDSEPTLSFHLTDHALIWQAIKSVEDMKIPIKPRLPNRDYSSRSLRQATMKGFTVRNQISLNHLPMLAIKRDSTLNRFHLDSTQTALIGAMGSGFFDDDQHNHTIAQWENTLRSQCHHKEDNGDNTYIDLRTFAVSILQLGGVGPSSDDGPFLGETLILLRSASANGLFPGNLNRQHEPAIHENDSVRDSYWENVFEIPYLLWKYCSGSNFRAPTASGQDDGLTPEANIQTLAHVDLLGNELPSTKSGIIARDWNSPQETSSSNMTMVLDDDMVAFENELFTHAPAFFGPPFTSRETTRSKAPPSFLKYLKECDGILIDFPKPDWPRKKIGSGVPMKRIEEWKAIEELMQRGRSHKTSPKRFWAFFSERSWGNSACLHTVSAREKKNNDGVEVFFDRHESYLNLFSEEISRTSNRWKTEFHMVMFDPKFQPARGRESWAKEFERHVISFALEGDFSGQYWTCRFLETDPHWGEDVKTSNESESELDMLLTFERPSPLSKKQRMERLSRIVKTLLRNRNTRSINMGLGKDVWHHRRVLELMLFDRAAGKMHFGPEKILQRARSFVERMLPEDDSSWERRDDKAAKSRMLLRTELLQNVLNILRILKDGLDENIEEIDLWLRRQTIRKAAGQDSSVGSCHVQEAIQMLQSSNEHHIQRIRRIRTRIACFERSTEKVLQSLHNEMELRRAGNIRQFTYVTVVFLPLGFATGLFSMSGAPATGTIGGMTSTAVVALAITVLLLSHPRTVRRLYGDMLWGITWFTKGLFEWIVGGGRRGFSKEDSHELRRFKKFVGGSWGRMMELPPALNASPV